MKKGVPISPGVAVARAYRVDEVISRHESHHVDASLLAEEARRFEEACAAASAEIEAIAERVREQVGKAEAAIFQAHQGLLQDPMLQVKVQSAIYNRGVDAATALQGVLQEYTDLFEHVQDESLKRRLTDLRDVLGRVMTHLGKAQLQEMQDLDESVVIVAREILPSQALMLQQFKVAGIITEAGGPSGHSAILARALGIPAVSGLTGILDDLHTGDLVAIDGREGHIYLRPGPEVEAAYRKLQREYVDLRDRLIENRDQEAVSRDGTRVQMLANVNGPADAVMAAKAGADGVGLYRTEFLFLAHRSVPDEEEQFTAYRQVFEAAPNNSVTIRTLDLGGDKHVPYLGTDARGANPFLGWRSIRLISAHPDFFQTQLRAILRAAVHGNVRLLFPMVSTLEEVFRLKRMVELARDTLRRRRLPCADNVPMGVMLEVPASALCINSVLDEVDFVSIGSNDLIQYIMAADRDNPKVAHLCDPFNPAIWKILNFIIKSCVKKNKPVTLCGEMAGRPRCFLPLFGMGLRQLSMSPAFVPTLKALVRSSELDDARFIARRVLRMRKIAHVKSYLTMQTKRVCPNVAHFDTRK
jgi:phosphoenolpyruvate-protein phosphotransferase